MLCAQTRPRKAAVELPQDVECLILSAGVHLRPAVEGIRTRAVIQLPECRPFYFSNSGTAEVLRSLFPDLTEEQLKKAVRRVRLKITSHARAVARATQVPWMERY